MNRRHLMPAVGTAIVALVLAMPAHAAQNVELIDGEVAHIQISRTEMTRLVMEGGQLRGLDVPKGDLSAKADSDAGDITLSPNVMRPIQGFVISATTGKKYAVIMRPTDIGIETVVLHERSARRPAMGGSGEDLQTVHVSSKASSYDAQISQIMITMANGTAQRGYQIQAQDADVPFLPGTRVTLTRIYASRTVNGAVYVVRNTGKDRIFLTEPQFYGPGVMAVGMDRAELGPGEETRVYVIRGADHG